MWDSKRTLYVGIDVHSREHRAVIMPVALLENSGTCWRKVATLAIRNNIDDFNTLSHAISLHTKTPQDVAIAVDYTGGYYSAPLVHFLQEKGYNVYHLEAKAAKSVKDSLLDEESKSDAIDASSTAYLLYLRDTHGLSFRISTRAPELGSQAAILRSLVVHRLQLTKLITQCTNRLHQLLLAIFPEGEAACFNQLLRVIPYYPTPRAMLTSNNLEKVVNIRKSVRNRILNLASRTVGIQDATYEWLITNLTATRIDALDKRDTVTSKLENLVAAHPYGRILLSFPYLGETAAATLISIIKEIERWPDRKKLKKGLGVYGKLIQSGTLPARMIRGREGSRQGRGVLFQVCALCIRRNAMDNDFRDYFLRQVSRNKPRKKALFSTMGKLAEIIYHCLSTSQEYQYQGGYKTTSSH